MPLKMPLRVGGRFRVLAAVAASYLAAFAPLLVFGWQGRLWATLLFVASWPLALLAGAISFFFSTKVVQRPFAWAVSAMLTATVLSLAILYLTTRSWIGSASVVIAVPAALIFYVLARLWLQRAAVAEQSRRVANVH